MRSENQGSYDSDAKYASFSISKMRIVARLYQCAIYNSFCPYQFNYVSMKSVAQVYQPYLEEWWARVKISRLYI